MLWFISNNNTVILKKPLICQYQAVNQYLCNMDPKFSIILPTYNRAHLISTAIQSVLAQSVTDWELIIIDDGSTDNTKEVVFGFGDKRILYGHQENKGRSTARNAGLHHARGQWVCFLDSDDWYLEDHLEAFENAINEIPDTRVFKTGVSFQKEDGKQLSKSEFWDGSQEPIPFILTNYASVLDLCISAEIAKKIGFPQIDVWEDKAYMTVLLRYFPWHQIPLRTVVALEHGGRSILTTYKDVGSINRTLDVMEKCLADVTLKDRFLGPTQQGFLLSTMVNANEMGLSHSEIKKIMSKVNKSILPMTWIRYWKIYVLGR